MSQRVMCYDCEQVFNTDYECGLHVCPAKAKPAKPEQSLLEELARAICEADNLLESSGDNRCFKNHLPEARCVLEVMKKRLEQTGLIPPEIIYDVFALPEPQQTGDRK
jgi:hypothetical protein